MIKNTTYITAIILVLSLILMSCAVDDKLSIDLSGDWSVKLDPQDLGENEKWFLELQNSELKIQLPSTLDEAGIGQALDKAPTLDKETLYELSRRYKYIGAAWYQRYITIPKAMQGRDVCLEMERVIWKSQVWIDGEYKGSDNSLVTAHSINLGQLTPGKHLLTICIDNRQQYDIFDDKRPRSLAHSYTETTQIKWNGILGEFKLKSQAPYSLQSVQVFSNIQQGNVSIKALGSGPEESITFTVTDANEAVVSEQVILSKARLTFTMNGEFKLWDEFNTHLYTLTATNEAGEELYRTSFGMREIASLKNDMLVNNKRVFLRGTLECCIFPLTGHPPMGDAEWEKVFGAAKSYGLNHLRFHSWCPPEAAFRVADRMGFYLQVEMPNWSLIYGEDMDMVNWMENEGRRMIANYGNHPSFCMMALGNELQGDYKLLSDFVKELQAKDPRHLYTTTAFTFQKPYSAEPNTVDEYWITQWTKDGWVRGQGVFDEYSPAFNKDFRASIEFLDIPLITHEIGQYSVYPNFKEIEKYTGVLDPLNFKAIKQDLEKKGRLAMAEDYLKASGHLAKILYKEEVERALKTPGISGFQLLDLHDFPGQGTALVGLLDAFWDSKGIITGAEFKQFCSELVPLLKFEKAVYTNNEVFSAKAELTNYWKDLNNTTFEWQIAEGATTLASGTLASTSIAQGSYAEIGTFDFPLEGIKKATKLDITLALQGTAYKNAWSIWVYPQEQTFNKGEVMMTSNWDKAKKALAQGRRVLLSPNLNEINGIKGKFVPVFWSPVHFPNQPGTMGLLIKPEHQALSAFPTEFHTNWQWWDLCKQSKSLNMEELMTEQIVTVVDNFFKNRNLSNLFEAKVGKGTLMFSSMDLHTNIDQRPVAKCLLSSLVGYMNSEGFNPQKEISFHDLESHFRKAKQTSDKRTGPLYDEDGF